MNDEVLTIPEVAQYLKMSKSKLYKLARLKRLPIVKIGKNVRVRESDLNRWLEEHKEEL